MRKKQLAFVMAPAVAIALSSAASADLIYDNGGPDGVSGLSNIFGGGFGADRQVADDFILPGGPGWIVENVEMNYIFGGGIWWGASDYRVTFYADDAGGGPGTIVSDQVSSSFTETPTGNTFFGRPEVISSIDIAPVSLAADTTYWMAIQPTATSNGFQLTSATGARNLNGDQVWVRYPKFGFPDYVPGNVVFSEFHDVVFRLNGEAVPAPGALALLGFAGILGLRRRRR
ncbi:MAG: choice-of-anchor R domain-containing protein [Phycisphaerales bacterium]